MGIQTADGDTFRLSTAILKAVDDRLALKLAGAAADGDAVLEAAVRRSWPFRRDWHYVCADCDDTGWQWLVCTLTTRCGRSFCQQHDERYRHGYVVPCNCAKGDAHRPKAMDVLTVDTKRRDRGWQKAHV